MLRAHLRAFGIPRVVVECAEVADVGEPGPGEVVVDVLASPINPADLLIIEGRYASRPPLPAQLGIEGAGRIVALGSGVSGLAEGDLVLSLARANWAQRIKVPADDVIKAPAGVDMRQLAMLKANPASAQLMLTGYVDLAPGDWVLQNAANSSVGANLIRLAKIRGLRTVNVVRRTAPIAALTDLGADAVVLDGDGLAGRVAEATGGAAVKLAVDAVAGDAVQRLAECLAVGGTVVNFGMLSGEPCRIGAEQTVFRGITLTGFWLAQALRDMPAADVQTLYGGLLSHLCEGRLGVEVEATYPLTEVQAALDHAGRGGRRGKVLLEPNPPN
jgi:NADPH:quinone reductase-like Zn-dependent oxidoreductase